MAIGGGVIFVKLGISDSTSPLTRQSVSVCSATGEHSQHFTTVSLHYSVFPKRRNVTFSSKIDKQYENKMKNTFCRLNETIKKTEQSDVQKPSQSLKHEGASTDPP